jgi:hypothetical protein
MIRFHVQHLFMPLFFRAKGLVNCLLEWYTFQLKSGILFNR